MARSENSSKIVVILIVLIVLGIGVWQGASKGNYTSEKIGESIGEITTTPLGKAFFTNFAIIAAVLLLLSFLLFPNNNSGKNSNAIRIIMVLVISILISYYLKENYVYNIDFIKGFLFDPSGKFTYKPLVNAGLIWAVIVFILPLFSEQIKKFQSGNGGKTNATFYIVILLISILIASSIGPNFLWEEETFKNGERFLLGDRVGDNLLKHTGFYTDDGKTKYGIFSYEKVNINGEEVTPVFTLIVSIVILHLALTLLERKATIPGGKGLRNILIFAFAAFNANRGSSISTIIALAYYFVVYIIHKETSQGIKIKVLPLAIALFAADTLAEFLIPFETSGFLTPPLFPESLFMKAILAFVTSFLISLIFGMGAYVIKDKTKVRLCKECGSRVKEKRENRWICPKCSYKCPDCGQQGVEKRGEKMICKAVGCDLYKVEVDKMVCTSCGHPNVESRRLRIVCEACDIEIKRDIETEELEGMAALSVYAVKRGGPAAGNIAGATASWTAGKIGGLVNKIRNRGRGEEASCSDIEAAATA